MQQLLAAGEEFGSGALVMIELRALASPPGQSGRLANASLLRQVVAMVESATQGDAGPDYFIARWSDTGFAISVTPTVEREALAFGECLALGCRQCALTVADIHDDSAHIGIAMYRRQSLAQWLGTAKNALRIAHCASEGAKRTASACLPARGVG